MPQLCQEGPRQHQKGPRRCHTLKYEEPSIPVETPGSEDLGSSYFRVFFFNFWQIQFDGGGAKILVCDYDIRNFPPIRESPYVERKCSDAWDSQVRSINFFIPLGTKCHYTDKFLFPWVSLWVPGISTLTNFRFFTCICFAISNNT